MKNTIGFVMCCACAVVLGLLITTAFGYKIETNGTFDVDSSNFRVQSTTGTDSSSFAATPNMFDNGTLEIWQKSTDNTGVTTTATYVADRWLVKTGSGTLAHVSRATTNQRSYGIAKNLMKLDGASGVTWVTIGQRLRAAYSSFMQRTMTVAAWIYCNNLTAAATTVYLYADTPNASDTFTSVVTRNNSGEGEAFAQSVPCATWTKVYANLDVVNYTNITNGLQIRFFVPDGALDAASKYVCITEMKLEEGSTPTPIAFESRSESWRRCREYWRQSYAEGTPAGTATATNMIEYYAPRANSSQDSISMFYGEPMRASPTITIYSTSDGESGHIRDVTTSANIAATASYISNTGGFFNIYINEGGVAVGNCINFHYTMNANL